MVMAYRNISRDIGNKAVISNEGGKVYTVSPWTQLRRFLILGTTGGTFYVSEQALSKENAGIVTQCLNEDPKRAIAMIVAVSASGVAPKNDPALFALAMAASHPDVKSRRMALTLSILRDVCRTGTHLLHFVDYVNAMRGWGRTLQDGVAAWYTDQEIDNVAFQAVKYRKRDGWSQRDVLRLAKPTPKNAAQSALFKWIVSGLQPVELSLPEIIQGFEIAQASKTVDDVCWAIAEYRLPREAVPTRFLNDPKVQEYLLQHMPLGAMVRNLGNLSKSGLVTQGSDASKFIVRALVDDKNIAKSKIHPMALLLAIKTYGSGHGFRGDGIWVPVQRVIDALDAAFDLSFGNVPKTNKRTVIGLDVSSSMQSSTIAGTNLTVAEAAMAMAMVTMRVEDDYALIGYTAEPKELAISPRMRLGEALAKMPRGGSTRCSIPATWAMTNFKDADAILNYTDNDTSDQNTYPALQAYRQKYGKDTVGVVTAMTALRYSIYPENDPRTLQVSGFDASTPAVIADFIQN